MTEQHDKIQQSLNEVEVLVNQAHEAQAVYATYEQQAVDSIIKKVSEILSGQAEYLAKLAHEETGFGKVSDKVIKNLFASEEVYESIKDIPTVGILEENKEDKVMKVAVPMGIVAGLIPSTNPTSTTIFKALLALKTRNAIILSPHPRALHAIQETARLINEAAATLGAPEHLVQVLPTPTLEATQALMAHKKTALILATGGEAMVRAAYSSGNPAIGVGPGNTPVLIEKSADIEKTVSQIISSKTFDNGTICASEQALVIEKEIKDDVIKALKEENAYFLSEEEAGKISKYIMRENGSMNPQIVGQTAFDVAALSDIVVPKGTTVLISPQTTVSKENPYSREKLTPILAMYTVEDFTEGVATCRALLENEGIGHTAVLHTTNDQLVREFGVSIPASRIIINSLAALGAIGSTTKLKPSLTLGCGAVGGSSLSENVHVAQLLNTYHIAYGME